MRSEAVVRISRFDNSVERDQDPILQWKIVAGVAQYLRQLNVDIVPTGICGS